MGRVWVSLSFGRQDPTFTALNLHKPYKKQSLFGLLLDDISQNAVRYRVPKSVRNPTRDDTAMRILFFDVTNRPTGERGKGKNME